MLLKCYNITVNHAPQLRFSRPLHRPSSASTDHESPDPLSSLESALTRPVPLNSFIIRTYKNRGVPPRYSVRPQTRSATVPSIRLKKKSPPRRTITTATAETSRMSPGGWPRPVMAHRKPSITPAIGFNPYSHRHLSGTSVLGYATGDANIQNWMANGIT